MGVSERLVYLLGAFVSARVARDVHQIWGSLFRVLMLRLR